MTLSELAPHFMTVVVAWILSRATKRNDAVHAQLTDHEKRITQTEVKIDGHHARLDTVDDALEDVRKNMVRREEFQGGIEAIGKRIDDALRR